MNITSCEQCGVVLDKDRLEFPEKYDHDTGEAIEGQSIWVGNDFVAVVECPVCKNYILET